MSAMEAGNNQLHQWFDCFDTLVGRACIEPTDVFMALGWRLQSQGQLAGEQVEAFALQRRLIEANLRKGLKHGDVTIESIYADLQIRFGWTDEATQGAREAELLTEIHLSVPVPAQMSRLNTLLEQGKPVTVLSDTYFDTSALRDLLDPHLCAKRDGLRLLASAQEQRTKSTGALFERALLDTGLKASQVVFCGDHPVSDQSVPASMGFRTHPIPRLALESYEYVPTRSRVEDRWRRVVAGAIRGARIECADQSDPGGIEAIVGYGGVALTGYVCWLLETARLRGINRIGFLARDGQILHRLAVLLAPWIHPDARLEYIHASRLAWCLPAYPDLSEALERWLARYVRGAPAESLVGALGVALPEARSILDAATHGLAPSADAVAAYARSSNHAFATMRGYLESIGFEACSTWMIVDVGWRASLQCALQTVLRRCDRADIEVHGAYVGLTHQPSEIDRDRLHVFAPGDSRINAAVVESLTRAAHGSVIGYRETGQSRFEPVLQAQDESHNAKIERAQHLMLTFATRLARWLSGPGFPRAEFLPWFAQHSRDRLVSLCRKPSGNAGRHLLQAWHDDGVGHSKGASLARRLKRIELWRTILAEVSGQRTCWWLEGTIAASTSGRPDFLAHFYAQRVAMRLARLAGREVT